MREGVLFKCTGNLDAHKCNDRKCPHRKAHVPGYDCGNSSCNSASHVCTIPGVKLPFEPTVENGGLVSCISIGGKCDFP